MDAPMEKVELGLFVVRGDNVAVISEVTATSGTNNGDREEEDEDDVRAEPIPPIVQNVT